VPAALAFAPLTCLAGGPLWTNPEPSSPVFRRIRAKQPCSTTRTLMGCLLQICPHHVPTPLCSTVITRFFATTRALTPTDPLTTGRGSLIHVTRTSNHSISNHLRISAGRVHSLCANSTILFGLRHC
jgi:hypothetical protein